MVRKSQMDIFSNLALLISSSEIHTIPVRPMFEKDYGHHNMTKQTKKQVYSSKTLIEYYLFYLFY